MLGLSKDRERSSRWQRAADLLLAEADVGALSKAVGLFYDAKLEGVLDEGQCINHLFGELNRGRLRGPDRESP